MIMKYGNDIIVSNLDMDQVSWSRTFRNSAESQGIPVVESPLNDHQNRLFIGDDISSRMLGRAANIYFLAAVDGTDEENRNILDTTYTTTVSNAEKERAVSAFGKGSADKIEVDGFPVNLDEVERVKELHLDKIERSVCFLGRTDADKGLDLEIELTRQLNEAGYAVFHLAPYEASARDVLIQAGSRVVEQLRGGDYLRLLSRMNCVVNTSPRESLFVSGIEAAALDVPVIAPDATDSGIRDWNDPENFYQDGNGDNALEAIQRACERDAIPEVSISQYHPKHYFARTFGRAS